MKSMRKVISFIVSFCMVAGVIAVTPAAVSAEALATDLNMKIAAEGVYQNWDGVSNVSQFVNDGQYCYAYYIKKKVYVVKTKDGVPQKDKIVLKMQYPIFGGVTCDGDGNYYVVTGKNNETDDTSVKTVFISKYDESGKHIKTVGDNGSSSLDYYYGSGSYTKIPFDGGNCDIAINGDVLAVHYARKMYSGHQSNSVFAVNIKTMEKVSSTAIYESHSFAQRVIPYGDDFLFASEGDCYSRAFTVGYRNSHNEKYTETPIFDFWVEEGTLDNWDMWTLNNNFAHMGGLAAVDDRQVALVGTSVKALNAKAKSQNEQLFIQIFDPSKDLSKKEAYITTGKRSGVAGPNGTDKVTNYGVKWLTKFGKKTAIQNPQVVSNGEGKIAVLYEKYVNNLYKGVYYMILDASGEIIESETCFSPVARLNPCRMPVYVNGSVYWTANQYKDAMDKVYVYSLPLI